MKKIWSVSELSNAVKESIESNFFDISVTGEISGLKWHSSGHIYFSLLEESSTLNVAFFRRYANGLSFVPSDGMRIVAFGSLSSYPPRSNYQLICRRITPAGEGDKLIALINLKRQLQSEGLFDKNRSLPAFPKRIAIVTSLTGAAIEDIKSVISRRFGGVTLFVFGALVEGPKAADSLIKAINRVKRDAESLNIDLLIITRGGGSKESLDLFNNEKIARLIYTLDIPVVSAIGHQIDETLVDLVADCRAETPTAAAELVSPDINILKNRYLEIVDNFSKSIKRYIAQKRLMLRALSNKISYRSLSNFFDIKSQKADFAIYNLNTVFGTILTKKKEKHVMTTNKIKILRIQFIGKYKIKVYNLAELMRSAILNFVEFRHLKLSGFINLMETLSPISTLKRGYTITLKDNRIMKLSDISTGDMIITKFYNGAAKSKVIGKKNTFK